MEPPRKGRGRPRCFDTDEALDAAMRVFWEKGYDGTSLPDLTEAMGINRPSLYATFGNKEALFQRAMERYLQKNTQLVDACMVAGSAREGMEMLLREAVAAFTDPRNPGGCFSNQATLSCANLSDDLKRALTRTRDAFEIALLHRFERAQEEGELPIDTSPRDLACFYTVVFQGLGLQATAGGTCDELMRVVDVAMAKWPSPM